MHTTGCIQPIQRYGRQGSVDIAAYTSYVRWISNSVWRLDGRVLEEWEMLA